MGGGHRQEDPAKKDAVMEKDISLLLETSKKHFQARRWLRPKAWDQPDPPGPATSNPGAEGHPSGSQDAPGWFDERKVKHNIA